MPIDDKVFKLTKDEVLKENKSLKQINDQLEKLLKSEPDQLIRLYEKLPMRYE